jgi:hypothetical protein
MDFVTSSRIHEEAFLRRSVFSAMPLLNFQALGWLKSKCKTERRKADAIKHKCWSPKLYCFETKTAASKMKQPFAL